MRLLLSLVMYMAIVGLFQVYRPGARAHAFGVGKGESLASLGVVCAAAAVGSAYVVSMADLVLTPAASIFFP